MVQLGLARRARYFDSVRSLLSASACLAGLIACGSAANSPSAAASGDGGHAGSSTDGSLAGQTSDGTGTSAGTSGNASSAGAGARASAEPCRSDAVWRAMSVDGIEWPEGRNFTSPFVAPASIPSGWYHGLVYALRLPLELMMFDPCANVWHTLPLRFSQADLEAAIGSIGSVQWEGEGFLVRPFVSDQAAQKMAQIKAGADSFELLPVSPLRAPDPDWVLPPLAVERRATSASTSDYRLDWGGAIVNNATKIGAGDPKTAPAADGMIYSFASGVWRGTNAQGAPSARYLPKIAPLADRFFVWGGFAESEWPEVTASSALADGAIYDPGSDTWSPVTASGAPAQTEQVGVTGPPNMVAQSNGHDVFVFEAVHGAGGVYDSTRNVWAAANPTTLPAGAQFHFTDDGDLIAIGVTDTLLLPKQGGNWQKFTQGRFQDALPSAAQIPEPTGFVLSVWTGRTLVRWGPFTAISSGCDGPRPPNTPGCDPVLEVTNYKFGAMLSMPALLPP